MTKLDQKYLYELLELPQEVRTLLNAYGAQRIQEIPEEIYCTLFAREKWDEGVKALQCCLGIVQICVGMMVSKTDGSSGISNRSIGI